MKSQSLVAQTCVAGHLGNQAVCQKYIIESGDEKVGANGKWIYLHSHHVWAQAKKAERTKPVVDRDHNHVPDEKVWNTLLPPTCQEGAVVRAPGRYPPPPEELRHGSTPWQAAGPARWFPERRRWGRGNPPGRPRAKDRTRRTSEDTWSWTLRTRPKDLLQVGEARVLGTCGTVENKLSTGGTSDFLLVTLRIGFLERTSTELQRTLC